MSAPPGKRNVFDHKRVTNHTNIVIIASIGASGCPFLFSQFTNFVCTFTVPFSKMRPSQSSVQLSGEWHHMRRSPCMIDDSNPFSSGTAICAPNIIEPGSGESNPARARATCSCFSSLNKWKKEDACIANTRPRSGLSEVRLHKSRAGPDA